MELREYLEIGAKKAGNLTALGKMLDINQPMMSNIKAHKEKLPIAAAAQLADFIGADFKAVIAANELALETKQRRRNYWLNFTSPARATPMILALACVTSFLTPYPAEAAPRLDLGIFKFVLC
jgi:hypothetical protein